MFQGFGQLSGSWTFAPVPKAPTTSSTGGWSFGPTPTAPSGSSWSFAPAPAPATSDTTTVSLRTLFGAPKSPGVPGYAPISTAQAIGEGVYTPIDYPAMRFLQPGERPGGAGGGLLGGDPIAKLALGLALLALLKG